MEENTPDRALDAVVAKSNAVIGALARFDLSELRFLMFCLSRLDSKGATNRLIRARVADLCASFPLMDKKSAYGIIKQSLMAVWKKPLEIQEGRKMQLHAWLSGMEYEDGEFAFFVSPEMEPYLLGLSKTFTQYRLKAVAQFRSANTWKLYENLVQWRTAGRWAVGLDELRVRLGVAGKYPSWYVFDRDVIAKAVAEINSVSDLRVEYHKERRGRKVCGLVFMIDKKVEDEDTITLERPADSLEKHLLDLGINAKTAADYAAKVAFYGKTDTILAKLPRIAERAEKCPEGKRKYILGSIKNELQQLRTEDTPPPRPRADHSEALECWMAKRRAGEVCPVREQGKAGQRKKCQMCLEKISRDLDNAHDVGERKN